MSLVTEIESIADFVKSKFPEATVEKQNVPNKLIANMFVVRLLSDRRSTETLFNMVVERDYQVVYFGSNVADVLSKIDDISHAVMNNQIVIPIKDSLRYIRVESFNFSQPFKTEGGLDSVIGVLQTQVREARDQEQFEKITKVNVATGYDENTWTVVEGSASTTDNNDGFTWKQLESGQYLFKI